MQKIMTLALEKLYGLRDKLAESRGQALIEYVLIGGGVALAIGATVAVLTGFLDDTLNEIGLCIDGLPGGGGCP
jgi:Flp pilus assembly pilin Flp